MRNTSMSQTITLNTKAYQWSGFTSADYGSWRYAGGGLASEFSYLTNQVKVGGGKQSSEIKWNLAVPHIADEASACACPGGVLDTDYVRILVQPGPMSSTVSRTDLLARIRSLVATNEFGNSVVNLEQQSQATSP